MSRHSDRDLFGEMPVQRKGAPPFPDQWSNYDVAQIVRLAMEGHSSPAISAELGGQIDPDDIKRMLLKWDVRPQQGRRRMGLEMGELSAHDRTILHRKASIRGLSMGDLAARVIHTMNVHSKDGTDMYLNVLDDGVTDE